jgi:acyl dehydratase
VDNIWMTLLTLNVQPVHFDPAYASKTEWKKMLVDSTLTLALLTGVSVRTVSAKVVANQGWDKVKVTHPVFVGDALYAESTVLSMCESKSRPTQVIVTVSTRGLSSALGVASTPITRVRSKHRRDAIARRSERPTLRHQSAPHPRHRNSPAARARYATG